MRGVSAGRGEQLRGAVLRVTVLVRLERGLLGAGLGAVVRGWGHEARGPRPGEQVVAGREEGLGDGWGLERGGEGLQHRGVARHREHRPGAAGNITKVSKYEAASPEGSPGGGERGQPGLEAGGEEGRLQAAGEGGECHAHCPAQPAQPSHPRQQLRQRQVLQVTRLEERGE